MAQPNVTEGVLSYYPPRARWYSRFCYPWFTVRRILHLEKIHLPGGLTFFKFIPSLIVPGFALFALGRRLQGRALFAGYCVASLVFVVALGYPVGNIACGLMISAHATSIIYLLGYWLPNDCRFGMRLAMAIGTLLTISLLVYSPALDFAERHWIVPLRTDNGVFIIRRDAAPASVQRGDWVAYQITDNRGTGVYLQSGFGMGPVLAVAGDRVRFTKEALIVNDEKFPRLPHMPVQGEFVVPEKIWFIWPRVDIIMHGAGTGINIPEVLQRTAMVPENQFIGKPFKHWFGRRQLP